MSSQSSNKSNNNKKRSKRNNFAPDLAHTKSSLAELAFPVSRVHRYMKEGGYSTRVSVTGAVFLASVLEYLAAEILEVSGNVTIELQKQRIKPRFIMIAVRSDEELSRLLRNVVIRDTGVSVIGNHEKIEQEMPRSKGKGKGKGKKQSQYSDSQTY